MPLSLLLFGALIIRGFTHVFLCKTPRDYAENRAPWSFNYGTGYPPPLLIFIIVLEYSTISPIILLFGTVYFCITYLVYKYQFLYGKQRILCQKEGPMLMGIPDKQFILSLTMPWVVPGQWCSLESLLGC